MVLRTPIIHEPRKTHPAVFTTAATKEPEYATCVMLHGLHRGTTGN